MTPTLSVFVQCPATLRPGFERCRTAIEESDIGKNYTLCMQRPEHGVFEHFLSILDQMAASDTDLVVRLEDDVDLNLYFVHNVVTWPRLFEKSFGMGWMFDPGGATCTIHDHIYQRDPSREYTPPGQIAYSLAVVMWKKDVLVYRDYCARWFAKNGGDLQDIALSEAPASVGKQLIVHAPSLCEHMIDMGSTLGHPHDVHGTSMGSFRKKWKRGDPKRDGHGQVIGVL